MKKVAVWNTAFLGDAVLTLPLLQSLRMVWPDARIDYYVRGGLSPLFAASPAVSNVYEFRKNAEQRSFKALRALGDEIRARGYDIWLSPHPSLRSAWLAGRSGASVRVGYSEPWYNRLFYTYTVNRRFPELHEIDRLLRLMKPLGLTPQSVWPEIALPDELRAGAGDFFRQFRGTPVLGLHPGSVWPTKRWPAAYFARIGQLALQRGAYLLVFGGPGEEETARDVLVSMSDGVDKAAQERIVNLAGKLGLAELAACIGKLSCYLGNDSGPMHLAWCQRVPTVALFGATVPALGFAPRGENSVVLEAAGMDCRPCGLHGPKVCPLKHHDCMNKLLPELVWPEVEKRLFG